MQKIETGGAQSVEGRGAHSYPCQPCQTSRTSGAFTEKAQEKADENLSEFDKAKADKTSEKPEDLSVVDKADKPKPEGISIKDKFSLAASGDLGDLVEAISGDEFNRDFLRAYDGGQISLHRAIEDALVEIGDDPFEAPGSYIRVMRLAMRRLKDRYHQDVPKGWLPIIDKLKGPSAKKLKPKSAAPAGPSEAERQAIAAMDTAPRPVTTFQKDVDPSEILGEKSALFPFREGLQLFSPSLVATARRHGVPATPQEARAFLLFVLGVEKLKGYRKVADEILKALRNPSAADSAAA